MTLDGALDISVAQGAVEFGFTVTNEGEEPVELTFTSGKVADLAVYEEGAEVWRWSDDRMFTQAVETRTLGPGDALIHEVSWDDPPPGSYTAEASLVAADMNLEERKPFDVA